VDKYNNLDTSEVFLKQITKNAVTDFSSLLKRSWIHAQEYHQRYGKDDARCDFFIVFSELNLWLLLQLDNFLELLDQSSTKIGRHMELTVVATNQFLLQYDTVNRSSYCTKAMFDVENFLVSIAKSLSLPRDNKGYFRFTRALLSHLGILDNQKFSVLNAPAQVRNALHKNGYADHDFQVTLRQRSYKFTKGDQVKFTGWGNLYIFFDELLDVLVEIIGNPNVQQVNKIPHTSTYYLNMNSSGQD
jgi:hypothetical protein